MSMQGLRWVRTLLGIVVGIALLGTGVAFATGAVQPPGVTDVDNRFGQATERTTTIRTDVVVYNPTPVGFTLRQFGLNYTVAANGVPLAHGQHRGLHITTGRSTVEFTTRLRNERISRWWTRHIRRGEQTRLTVSVGMNPPVVDRTIRTRPVSRQFSTNMLAAINSTADRPVTVDSLLVANPIVIIDRTSATWGNVTRTHTPIQTTLAVTNPHPYPVVITEVGYEIRMNDVSVGTGETESRLVLEPHETQTVTARTLIRNERLDEWWPTHVRRGQVTTLRIDYYLQVDLSAAGLGTVQAPLETMRTRVTTDFFGGNDQRHR